MNRRAPRDRHGASGGEGSCGARTAGAPRQRASRWPSPTPWLRLARRPVETGGTAATQPKTRAGPRRPRRRLRPRVRGRSAPRTGRARDRSRRKTLRRASSVSTRSPLRADCLLARPAVTSRRVQRTTSAHDRLRWAVVLLVLGCAHGVDMDFVREDTDLADATPDAAIVSGEHSAGGSAGAPDVAPPDASDAAATGGSAGEAGAGGSSWGAGGGAGAGAGGVGGAGGLASSGAGGSAGTSTGGGGGSAGSGGAAGEAGPDGGRPADDGGSSKRIGAACDATDPCPPSLKCDTYFPKGMCTRDCSMDSDCQEPTSAGICEGGQCFRTCVRSDPTPCPRTNYQCLGRTGRTYCGVPP